MAEILVKAIDHIHPDPEIDRKGCYKKGMPVVVMPDNHEWGAKETLPLFVIIKIPGIPVETVKKYIMPELVSDGGIFLKTNRKRLWVIRWNDLPQKAQRTLQNDGILTIKAGSYNGPADYTWQQIKGYFRNQSTGLDETEDI